MISDKRLLEVLEKSGILPEAKFNEIVDAAGRSADISLHDYVLQNNLLTDEDIASALMIETGRSFVRLSDQDIDENIHKVLPAEICIKHTIMPISVVENVLTIAVEDSLDPNTIFQLRTITSKKVVTVIAESSAIRNAITKHYNISTETDSKTPERLEDVLASVQESYGQEDTEITDVGEGVNEESAPIIRLGNRIIEEAYLKGASDIHVEPFEKFTKVRYRIDGILQSSLQLSRSASGPLVARLKILSNLDIAEKRLPQDGRINFMSKSGGKKIDIDLRVSTCPVNFGEKVVMRILDKSGSIVPLEKMGFSDHNLSMYRESIAEPYGMVLNVGPTGSGKTTTLYSAINEINRPEVNIQTAEDPVEYILPNINQVLVQAKIGFTFAAALRSFLRQDPDIILIGEIRDLETAEIAVEASLTGHLIFSTLHTNDAIGTIDRFIEMGVEPWLLASSINCVCAQRLVRRLCTCRTEVKAGPDNARLLKCDPEQIIYEPNGCSVCENKGFKGRIGVHEVLKVSSDMRELISKGSKTKELREQALSDGMILIRDDCIQKVLAGITTVSELMRVVK